MVIVAVIGVVALTPPESRIPSAAELALRAKVKVAPTEAVTTT